MCFHPDVFTYIFYVRLEPRYRNDRLFGTVQELQDVLASAQELPPNDGLEFFSRDHDFWVA